MAPEAGEDDALVAIAENGEAGEEETKEEAKDGGVAEKNGEANDEAGALVAKEDEKTQEQL